MFDEAIIVDRLPDTFPACKKCRAAMAMLAQLVSNANSRLIDQTELTAEVSCKFSSNTPSGGVILSGKVHPTQVENNSHYWSSSPPVTTAKCPVIEQVST